MEMFGKVDNLVYRRPLREDEKRTLISKVYIGNLEVCRDRDGKKINLNRTGSISFKYTILRSKFMYCLKNPSTKGTI